MATKISPNTLKIVNELPNDKRQKVDAIIREHVQACRKNGFNPENLDRAYLEAVEQVKLEERFPETNMDGGGAERDWEPLRQYEQYVSPKAA